MVGSHNEDSYNIMPPDLLLDQMGDFIQGFKNGIVGVTGVDSKYYLCNTNITLAEDVFYLNYKTMFLTPEVIEENFSAENEDATMLLLMDHI